MPNEETTSAAGASERVAITAEEIRGRMRMSTTAHDAQIEAYMLTAKAELSRVGVNADLADPLIDYAMELFCKGEFNFDGNGDAYLSQFENLRDSLKLSDHYRANVNDGGGSDG